MLRLIFTSILLSCCGYFLQAQYTEILRPIDFLTQFQDVYVDNNGFGWATGTCNTLASTSDDGMEWKQEASPIAGDLETVACPASGCQTAIIIASNDEMARSTDGGFNWTVLSDPDWPSPNRLDFLSENVVICQAGDTRFLRSADAGASWTMIELPVYQAATMEFPSATTGYFFGGDDNLYTSTDAGLTWTTNGYTHSSSVRKIAFVDTNNGFLFDQTRALFKTTDGGLNWTEVVQDFLPSNLTLLVALSTTELRGVQVSDRVYTSSDGGSTWTSETINLGDGAFVKRNYHQRGGEFFLVSNLSEIYYSAANFENWESQIPAERIDVSAILFTSNTTGYIGTRDGELLKTEDVGDTWNLVQQFTQYSIQELHQLSNGNLLVINNGATPIQVSSDGGLTFTDYLPTSVTDQLDNGPIAFAQMPGGRLYFMGYEEAVYSDDGGTNWTVLDLTGLGVNPQNGLYFYDDNLGFFADSGGGRMGRTTDGGLSWTNLTDVAPTTQPLQTFYFSDALNGIAFNAARAYRTSDGGDTWTNDNSLPGASGYQVDGNGQIYTAAFASGNNGSAHRSSDGGANWAEFGYTCAPYRTSAITPNGQYFFAAGDGGNVVRYDLGIVNPTQSYSAKGVEMLAFPNPAREFVTVQITGITADQSINLSLFDLQGRRLQQGMLAAGQLQTQMPLHQLPAGVYLLSGTSNNGKIIMTQRLVVE